MKTGRVQEPLWALDQVFDGAELCGIHHERIIDTAEHIKAAYQIFGCRRSAATRVC